MVHISEEECVLKDNKLTIGFDDYSSKADKIEMVREGGTDIAQTHLKFSYILNPVDSNGKPIEYNFFKNITQQGNETTFDLNDCPPEVSSIYLVIDNKLVNETTDYFIYISSEDKIVWYYPFLDNDKKRTIDESKYIELAKINREDNWSIISLY